MKFRKGDEVIVISGNDKGRIGEIKQVLRKQNRVVVDGVNKRWKRDRPTQQNPQPERREVEFSIHASNVNFYDAAQKKGVRKRPQEA